MGPAATTFPIILAGPSGAGKTTIRDRLLAGPGGARFRFSVSMTTRGVRPGEREGVDYTFASREAFEALAARGDMLEHATVHGELYGTPRSNLTAARQEGVHLLLDIDVQGARQVRAAEPSVASIFLVPPSGDRILERLARRGSETSEQLRRRLESARAELDAAPEFDYLVVNDDLDRAVARVRAIVDAEEVRLARLDGADGDATAFLGRIRGELDR